MTKISNTGEKISMKGSANDGFALVLTLWVLAIISVLILTFSLSVNLSLKNAAYMKDSIEGRGYTIAALNRLKLEVVYPPDKKKSKSKKDEKNSSDKSTSDSKSQDKSKDNTGDDSKKGKMSVEDKEKAKKRAEWYHKMLGKWYVEVEDWTVDRERRMNATSAELIVCEITAEDALFDLKKIKDIEKLGEYPEDILQNIKNKLKDDKKFALTCVPQLLIIDGVEGENYDGDSRDLKGLKNILTTFSDGKVYVNTAPSEALSMIPGLDGSVAESIAENTECLSSFDEVSDLIGSIEEKDKKKIEKWLKFVPEYFRIKAYRSVNGIDELSEVVVSIKDGKTETLLLK
jgi:hypothetical protein